MTGRPGGPDAQEPLIAEVAIAAEPVAPIPRRRRADEPVVNRTHMSLQRLRIPADLSAAAVGVLVAGAAPANVARDVVLMATLVRLGTCRKHPHLSVLTELPHLVLAQVHDVRGDTSIEERARFDNYYVEHWTP